MKRLLTLFIALGILFPGVFNEDSGWTYKQTTGQCFYIIGINSILIDGEPIQPDDVIGVFTPEGVCIGWMDGAGVDGFITVPAMSNGDGDYSSNYGANGMPMEFRVFDASKADDSSPTTQNAVLPLNIPAGHWFEGSVGFTNGEYLNNSIYVYSNEGGDPAPATASHVEGCFDDSACSDNDLHWLESGSLANEAGVFDITFTPSGGTLTTDDGSCLYDDCNGDCDGSAFEDNCGTCAGGETGLVPDAEDLGCGCFEPGPSGCDNVCNSELVFDCDGVCGGDSFVDNCGDCLEAEAAGTALQDASCTGCMNSDASNFDETATIESGGCSFSVDAPSGLAVSSGPARLTLEWSPVASDSYSVYDANSDGPAIQSGLTNPSTFVTSLTPGEEYCYNVEAIKEFTYEGETFTLISERSATACGTPDAVEGITWGWQLTAEIDGWGIFPASTEHNYLGFAPTTSNQYDEGFDIPEPPLGASQNYIQAYFYHPEWGQSVYGDNFTQDIRNEVPEDLPLLCDGETPLTNLQCNLIEFEVVVVSDMSGEASLTFNEYSTAHAANPDAEVPVPLNVKTYAEIDGVHFLIEEDTTIDFYLSEEDEKVITITIGNIVPQAPENLSSTASTPLMLDLDWSDDSSSNIQSERGRYPAQQFDVYRDGLDTKIATYTTDLEGDIVSAHIDKSNLLSADVHPGFSGDYGLLWESEYTHTVTATNTSGESTFGHQVSHHTSMGSLIDAVQTDINVTIVPGRQSDITQTTIANSNPVAVTDHIDTENGTNLAEGIYEVTHDGDAAGTNITIDGTGAASFDSDENLDGVAETALFEDGGEGLGRYSWDLTSVSVEDVEYIDGSNTSDAVVTVNTTNPHDGVDGEADSADDEMTVVLTLTVETDYPVKGGVSTNAHSETLTLVVHDEPNHDPEAPSAFGLRDAGNGLSVETYDQFLDNEGEEAHNDDNDYDGEDQIWYVPHDADRDTDVAALHFNASSTDADSGDILGTAGVESRDVLTYQYSLITGAAAGFTFTDLDDNGFYDFGEPIFYGGDLGDEIYIGTDYGDEISAGPTPDLIDGSEDFATIADAEVGDGGELLDLRLPSDVYIISMTVTDPYGDTDDVSYVISVSSERNQLAATDAGDNQRWYMNYEEDYKDISMSDHSISDSDNDPLVYGYSYSYAGDVDAIPTTNATAQTQNDINYEYDGLADAFWSESGMYNQLVNDQGLTEGLHTFTLSAKDPYMDDAATSSFTIDVRYEPEALAPSELRVTNPHQAFKHIEVAWQETKHADDAFTNDDGVNEWTGDYANTDYFLVYMNGELRARYDNDDDQFGETYTHLEPALESSTDYEFTVESYNSDDYIAPCVDVSDWEEEADDNCISNSDVSKKTHDRPTVTILNPSGAEIASVDDLYDVDIEVTNPEFVSGVKIEFLNQDGGYDLEEEDVLDALYDSILSAGNVEGAHLTTGEHTTQVASDGVEIHYGAKIKVTLTDVGNYYDVEADADHSTGVLDESNVNVSEDAGTVPSKETKDGESSNSFTVAAHSISKPYWAGWHLFGPVLDPTEYGPLMDLNLSRCFGNFGEYWVAYDQMGNFDVPTLQLNLGQGYYLALASNDDMVLEGDPVTGDPDDDGALATLSLDKGWNLLSNPLTTFVDKETLTVSYTDDDGDTQTLPWQAAADAGWVQTNINTWYIDSHMHVNQMVPFGGYWFHSSRALEVHVDPHVNYYSSRVAEENNWSLTLKASDPLGVAGGDFVTVTIDDDADSNFTYGEDEIDHPNPMQSEFIDMHIDRFDWVGSEDRNGVVVESPYFTSDVRPASKTEDFLAWNISADAYNVEQDIAFNWDMTGDIDSDVHLIIRGEMYNLKEMSSIEVSSNSIDNMVLVVGDIDAFFAPEEFSLSAAYPNPFNPSTSLDLNLDASGFVSVKIYNVLGQLAATLANGHMDAGYHTMTWNASNMASGMYFVKVEAGSNVAVQKMMLMK